MQYCMRYIVCSFDKYKTLWSFLVNCHHLPNLKYNDKVPQDINRSLKYVH